MELQATVEAASAEADPRWRGLMALLEQVSSRLDQLSSTFEPAALAPADAARLVHGLVGVERRVVALRLLCGPRAVESEAATADGQRTPEHWLASEIGTGVASARRALVVGRRLGALEATSRTALRGALSEAQVAHVAEAAALDPGQERRLLDDAEHRSFAGLLESCEQVKAQARSTEADAARMAAAHARRCVHHGRDASGGYRVTLQTTMDVGAKIVAAIDRRARLLADRAARGDTKEPYTAHQADALAELVLGGSAGGAGGAADIVFVVDAEAFRRGELIPGERCELAGVGPVPMALIEHYVGQSRVDLVVTRGVEVATVVSMGRAIPRALQLALEVRDPTCVVPGCDATRWLEIDHWQIPFWRRGPTALWNLCRLCSYHHALKTFRGWRLTGGPGRWAFGPPRAASRMAPATRRAPPAGPPPRARHSPVPR